MRLKSLLLLLVLLVSSIVAAQTPYCLETGHKISIRILSTIKSDEPLESSPTAKVAGDVYDETGEYILIESGTPVTLQVEVRKANLSGDVGRIAITPISTTAYNGREITFEAEPIIYLGNENGFFRSQMNVSVLEGTAFTASIANKYCFKIE